MQAGLTITVRPARPDDAYDIAAVHVAGWQSAYPGIVPDRSLVDMSTVRQAASYASMIRHDGGVFVAVAGDEIVGFTSVGRHRHAGLADGEIYTLYVLDDWREAGIGRQLMQTGVRRLLAEGCRSVFLWVLSDNPSRWFYQHLGGRAVAVGNTPVGGQAVAQTAYIWNPIEILLAATEPKLKH